MSFWSLSAESWPCPWVPPAVPLGIRCLCRFADLLLLLCTFLWLLSQRVHFSIPYYTFPWFPLRVARSGCHIASRMLWRLLIQGVRSGTCISSRVYGDPPFFFICTWIRIRRLWRPSFFLHLQMNLAIRWFLTLLQRCWLFRINDALVSGSCGTRLGSGTFLSKLNGESEIDCTSMI